MRTFCFCGGFIELLVIMATVVGCPMTCWLTKMRNQHMQNHKQKRVASSQPAQGL